MDIDPLAALRRIRSQLAAIPTTLPNEELNYRLRAPQCGVARVVATIRPELFPAWKPPTDTDDEIWAWQRLLDHVAASHPELPRIPQVARAYWQVDDERRVYLTTPDGASVWLPVTLAYVDALIRHVCKLSGEEVTEWTYPRVRRLFLALIDAICNLEGLADELGEFMSRPTDRTRYYPPLAILQREMGHPPTPEQVSARKRLEETVTLPASDGLPAQTVRRGPSWIVRADEYWDWWATTWDKFHAVREAVDDAAPGLDAGEVRILERPSHQIRQAVSAAEHSTSLTVTHGWNPFRYPASAVNGMHSAIRGLLAWMERLRPLAERKGSQLSAIQSDAERQLTPEQKLAMAFIRTNGQVVGKQIATHVGRNPATIRRWCKKGGPLYLCGVRNKRDGGGYIVKSM